MVLLLLYEYSLNGVDNQRWWGHSNPAFCLKNELLALIGGGDIKKFEYEHLCPGGISTT